MLEGTVVVAPDAGAITVRAGEAIIAHPGERVRYSTPESAEYVSVCVPAFSPETVRGDPSTWAPGPQECPREPALASEDGLNLPARAGGLSHARRALSSTPEKEFHGAQHQPPGRGNPVVPSSAAGSLMIVSSRPPTGANSHWFPARQGTSR